MNNEHYVEFKKERDLGAIITDTFKFIRLEWKPFLTTVFKTALIPILVAVASMLYYSYASSSLFVNLEDVETQENALNDLTEVALPLFVMSVCYIVAYVLINVGAMYYIKSYIDNKGVVNYDETKQQVTEKFWSFLGLYILVIIILIVSMMLCFLPIIYTGIVLSLASSLLVFENKTVLDAISDSFKFVHGHWWETFGITIVVGILISVLSGVFSIPALIYQLIQGISVVNTDITKMSSMLSDPIYLFFNVISTLAQFVFYGVTIIATVLIYFDINEQKNASGTFDQIESLGK